MNLCAHTTGNQNWGALLCLNSKYQKEKFTDTEQKCVNAHVFHVAHRIHNPESEALSLDLLLLYVLGQTKTIRILEYLAEAKYSPENYPAYNEDFHVAWLTVLHAANGYDRPWDFAILEYYGTKSHKWIEYRRAKWEAWEKALAKWAEESTPIVTPLVPKKPSQSIGRHKKEKTA